MREVKEDGRVKRLKWKPFWMVQSPEGIVWLEAASQFSRRGAIKNWVRHNGYSWRWWYSRGWRVGLFSVAVKPAALSASKVQR